MELRCLRYSLQQWMDADYSRGAAWRDGDSVLKLQYRDGVTHDAPWLDVPVMEVPCLSASQERK